MTKTKSGFTIVELLIVIVIIAILATISIVTYSGLQARASISAGKSFDASLHRALSINKLIGYSFNEGSGGSAEDDSEQGNNAVVNGTWVSGMESGNAIRANNNGTGARTSGPVYFGSESFTITAWVNSSDQDGSQSRIFGESFTSGGYFWFNFGNGRPSIESRDSTSTLWSTGSASTNISGKWAHVAAVVDRTKGTASVYINGKLETQRTTVSSGTFGDSTNTSSFYIGYQSTSATLSLDGIIDDVQIYKSALNVAAINRLYAEGEHRLVKL